MANMEMHLSKKHTYIYSVWIKIIYVIIEFNAIAFDNIGFKYENY